MKPVRMDTMKKIQTQNTKRITNLMKLVTNTIASSAGFLREKALIFSALFGQQLFKVWTFFIGIDMREANIFIINSLFP